MSVLFLFLINSVAVTLALDVTSLVTSLFSPNHQSCFALSCFWCVGYILVPLSWLSILAFDIKSSKEILFMYLLSAVVCSKEVPFSSTEPPIESPLLQRTIKHSPAWLSSVEPAFHATSELSVDRPAKPPKSYCRVSQHSAAQHQTKQNTQLQRPSFFIVCILPMLQCKDKISLKV